MNELVIGPEAVARLAAFLERERWDRHLVVMDVNTREALGARVLAEIGGPELVFEQRAGLLAGPDQAEVVRARLGADTRAIAVGSGVITDIVRYASDLAQRDFISVPTAASMDGYASSVAAMQLDGVKLTYPARAPVAIFADPRVAAAAPAELTRSGIGDLLAKATARVDWMLAHLLYGEPYDEAVERRVLEPLSFAAENAGAVMSGDPDAIRTLIGGLVESGIAMAMIGNSRPASGCEHHASHFWDLLASRGLRAHAPHGLQVGYATRFAIRLQRFACGGAVAELLAPVPVVDPLGPAAREWLGEPTAEIVAAVREKQQLASRPIAADWSAVRDALAPALAGFGAIESALDVAGIPSEPGYLEIDERVLRATFRYATRLRARYTTVDFLEGQQKLDQAIDAMLA